MVGVLPVLPPVEAVEVRLRHWTHRVVGIPLTIYRHSEAMRGQLRRHAAAVKPGELPDYRQATIPAWVKDVADPYSINHAFEARDDLDRLTPWTMTGRGEWPTGETNRAVEALFDEQTAAAQRRCSRNFEEQVTRTAPARAGPDRPNAGHSPVTGSAHELGAGLQGGDRRPRRTARAARRRRREAVRLRHDRVPRPEASSSPRRSRSTGSSAGRRSACRPAAAAPAPRLRLRHPLRLALAAIGQHVERASAWSPSRRSTRSCSIVVLFLLPLMAALNYRFWRKQA